MRGLGLLLSVLGLLLEIAVVAVLTSGCGEVCADVEGNATISRIGWDATSGRASIAIDRAIGYCESTFEDEPDHARDVLQLDPAAGTWVYSPSVALADDLPQYPLPAGAVELYEGDFNYRCEGCSLTLPVSGASGAGVLHVSVPSPLDWQTLIELDVEWQGALVLECAIAAGDVTCEAGG